MHLRNAVAGLRALGRGGVGVLAVGPGRASAGRWSRRAAARATAPDVLADPRGFAAAVRRLADAYGVSVVYPGREEAIDALYAAGEPALPYASEAVVRKLREKRNVPVLAANAGLDAPRTLADGAAGTIDPAAVPVPAVVKPAFPGGALASAVVVETHGDLAGLLGGLAPDAPVLVQEHRTGRLRSLELVLDRSGELVAHFEHRVERTWPAEAGGIVFSRSIPPDRALADRVRAMLVEVGYFGLIQLQLLEADEALTLIDLNPRFYGPLPLALACGVNLPAAWHAVVRGLPAERVREYRVGLAYRRLEGDLYAARRGHLRRLLSLAPRPRAGGMWDARDPLPSLLLGGGVFAAAIRKRTGRPA